MQQYTPLILVAILVLVCYYIFNEGFCFLQDKVMLGTDYPFPLGELEPGTLIESMDEFDSSLKVR